MASDKISPHQCPHLIQLQSGALLFFLRDTEKLVWLLFFFVLIYCIFISIDWKVISSKSNTPIWCRRQIFARLLFNRYPHLLEGGGRDGGRGGVRVFHGIFKGGACIVVLNRDASVSAPPVCNLIQSTSDNKEWDGKKQEWRWEVGGVYPYIRAILSLYYSLPWRNLRGVMLVVGLFFLFIYQFIYFGGSAFMSPTQLCCSIMNSNLAEFRFESSTWYKNIHIWKIIRDHCIIIRLLDFATYNLLLTTLVCVFE